MKQIVRPLQTVFCLAIFICAAFTIVKAQNPPSKLYLQGGAGGGSYQSSNFDIGLKAVFNKKWSMTLAYKGLEMTPKNQPSDYEPETGYVLFLPFTYEVTTDMSIVSVTGGRYFSTGRNTWVTTEAGLSYISGEKVSYKKQPQVTTSTILGGSTSSNYETAKTNKSGVGVMLQADFTWGFASFAGLGVNAYANVNSVQSPVGFEIKLLAGKMGRTKKQKALH